MEIKLIVKVLHIILFLVFSMSTVKTLKVTSCFEPAPVRGWGGGVHLCARPNKEINYSFCVIKKIIWEIFSQTSVGNRNQRNF